MSMFTIIYVKQVDIQIAIVNRKSFEAIIPTTQVYQSFYYHAIYLYHSIYHVLSTLPLHVPSNLYLHVYTRSVGRHSSLGGTQA